MPANCAIFGCKSSRRHKGVSLFKVPSGDDEFSSNWRKNITDAIKKFRDDTQLKVLIEKKKLYISERHFSQ